MLTKKIQELRAALENEIKNGYLNSDKALEISRELDALINEYYQSTA